MRGVFQSCGQNCIGLERLIVYDAIYQKFVDEMEKRIKDLNQGPPLEDVYDTGAMVMSVEASISYLKFKFLFVCCLFFA